MDHLLYQMKGKKIAISLDDHLTPKEDTSIKSPPNAANVKIPTKNY
jgi:hypothetical protein